MKPSQQTRARSPRKPIVQKTTCQFLRDSLSVPALDLEMPLRGVLLSIFYDKKMRESPSRRVFGFVPMGSTRNVQATRKMAATPAHADYAAAIRPGSQTGRKEARGDTQIVLDDKYGKSHLNTVGAVYAKSLLGRLLKDQTLSREEGFPYGLRTTYTPSVVCSDYEGNLPGKDFCKMSLRLLTISERLKTDLNFVGRQQSQRFWHHSRKQQEDAPNFHESRCAQNRQLKAADHNQEPAGACAGSIQGQVRTTSETSWTTPATTQSHEQVLP